MKTLISDYVKEYDMTFILSQKGNQMEVKGFYFGEPDENLTSKYNGKMKADFEMSVSEYSNDYIVNTIAVYSEKYDITFIMTDNNFFLELSGVYAGKPQKGLNYTNKGIFFTNLNKKKRSFCIRNDFLKLMKR